MFPTVKDISFEIVSTVVVVEEKTFVEDELIKQCGAVAKAELNATMHDPPGDEPTVTFPAISFPVIEAAVPHDETTGVAPVDIKCPARLGVVIFEPGRIT